MRTSTWKKKYALCVVDSNSPWQYVEGGGWTDESSKTGENFRLYRSKRRAFAMMKYLCAVTKCEVEEWTRKNGKNYARIIATNME